MEAENERLNEMVELVREKHALLGSDDYFALLGVPRESDTVAARDAYFELAKYFHPDAISRLGLDEGTEKQALEVFKALSEAYNILVDRKRRIMYEQEGAEAVSPRSRKEAAAARDKVSEARIFFHKGTMFLQRRAYGEAASCFFKAVELDDTSGRYMCYLGHALMLNLELPEKRRLDEAREWFEKAIETSQNDHEPYYYMSLYHKAVGNVDKQRANLQDALTINANHVESKREARLLAMRSRRNSMSGVHSIVNQVKAALEKLTRKK